jgi:uncharacterized protein (DUF488 family)
MDDQREQEVSPPGALSVAPAAGSLYTVGHSIRPIAAFLELLTRHAIAHLIDVRRHPGSRRHPQFGSQALASALQPCGIAYTHIEALGGRRIPREDSPNAGWRNASFRGYADYMDSTEFGQALDRVRSIAGPQRTVLMCAEALPWRCHRSLIADALVASGRPVVHILDNALRSHELPPFARVRKGRVDYPGRPPKSPPPELFAP